MIYGVGFNEPIEGEKVYKATENRKPTKCYYTWSNILKRCYDPKLHAKQPTYKDVIVANEWLNYQNFAKWWDDNYYKVHGEKMELDKDLLSKDGKVYSPNTCLFLPHSINNALINGKGYTFNKQTNKYKAQTWYKNKRINLGYFDTEKEARYTYKLNKQLVVYLLAEEYKEYLPPKVYEALMNYQMDIDDDIIIDG